MEIREALQNAIKEHEAAEEVVEVAEVVDVQEAGVEETAAEAEARLRDEKGRFAKKEQPAEEVAAPVEEVVVEQKPRPAVPSSWKKEVAEKYWNSIDPELADYITQREGDFHKGLQTYKEAANFGRELHQVFTPHAEFLQKLGATPAGAVNELMNTARVLYEGDPLTKARMIAELAHRHGVDVGALAEIPPVDPQIRALEAQVQRLSQFLSAQQPQATQPDYAPELASEIQQFRSTHEHFDLVREDMAVLLESGRAQGIEDAYNKAIRMNDQAWQATQAQQQAAAAKAKQEAAAKAKAAAVSVKGSSPGAAVSSAAASTDLRETLRANVAAMRDRL